MSSYINIYIRHKDENTVTSLMYCSRNCDIYQNIDEECNPIFIDKLNCKEWYLYSHKDDNSRKFKYVKTKEEAIHPIPENKEYEQEVQDFCNKKVDKITKKPVYYGYFVQEEYDALPDKNSMIINKCTKVTNDNIFNIISNINKQIISTRKRINAYKLHLADKEKYLEAVKQQLDDISDLNSDDVVQEILSWEEYADELVETKHQFETLSMIMQNNNTLYCYID